MTTEQNIIHQIQKSFPDFTKGNDEEIFHLFLGNFTAYLYAISTDADRFKNETEKLAPLLNELFSSSDLDEGTKITLTDEIMEFYAHADDRMKIIRGALNAESLKRLDTAKETLEYWKNFKK